MTEDNPTTPTSGTFGLPAHSISIQRARPADTTAVDHDGRIPLRVETPTKKLAKRESRLGLRSIFGRPRAEKDGSSAEDFSMAADASRSGGIRASLVDFSGWPYGQHHGHSNVSLPAHTTTDRAKLPTATLRPQPSAGRLRQAPFSPREPLFQAYRQAVKHATLPACTTSMDTLLRLQASRTAAEDT